MRVRITRAPTSQWVDAIRLDTFHVGQTYDVGYTVATYLLAQGWAEVADAPPEPLTEGNPALDSPRSFVRREGEPPLSDGVSILPERRRGERRQVTDRRRLSTRDRRQADRRGQGRDQE